MNPSPPPFFPLLWPPQFLSHFVEEYGVGADYNPHQQRKHQKTWRNNNNQRKDKKKDLPSRAVVEVKPLLVGIHERVRSDIVAHEPPSSVPSTIEEGGKRVPTATNPSAEDAAELLRMCLQCGLPKTFSSACGMVRPVYGDRPTNTLATNPRRRVYYQREGKR